MESMTAAQRDAYHSTAGLERAVIDLVRVGTRGHGAGVRQLASRLMRNVPPGVEDAEAFRDAVHQALSASSRSVELRLDKGAVPTEGDSAQALVDVDALPDGEGLTLDATTMSHLEEVVSERLHVDALRRAGVGLTRTILLCGPPGVGKTMAARWLAEAMGLPLLTLDLASVVSSYLGSSGRNIKAVLEYAKSGPCVLLLDEFDAIAKRRDDESDIGELKRIVNVILVELDRWPDTSLLVAATNHPQLLDAAVDRRFDRTITLSLPGFEERSTILLNLSQGVGGLDAEVIGLVAAMTSGSSGADLSRQWLTAARRAVMSGGRIADVLIDEVARHCEESGPARDILFLSLHDRLEMSNRQIAALTGVSHPTVAAGIKRAKGVAGVGRS